MGISVLSSLLKSRLNVLSSFAMVTMVDLKFTGHSLDVFLYYKTHKKNKEQNPKKNLIRFLKKIENIKKKLIN